MKNIVKKSVYIVVAIYFCFAVVSCESDFTDIDTNVISNTKFDTNEVTIDITASNSPLEVLQTDNISRQINQYLLGVYASSDYEKIEASIVSQLNLEANLQLIDDADITDTTTVLTKIDTVFLKLPYPVALEDVSDATSDFEFDGLVGDASTPYTLNVYRSNTFLNNFNPSDPTKLNSYDSKDSFEKVGNPLNSQVDYPLAPSLNDTMFVVKRRMIDDTVVGMDTIKIFSSAASTNPIPFARIPLDEDLIQQLFLDKYEDAEFSSQESFNDYFRGVILEASGADGSLITYNFDTAITDLSPSIEVYYTNTVYMNGTTDTIKTVRKNNTFLLSGYRVNTFDMQDRTYPVNNEIKIQGAAGSEGEVTLFDDTVLSNLRANNWLINDASLTFYINQSADTASVPERLYLYKTNGDTNSPVFSQIEDAITEAAFGGIDGNLERDSDGKVEKYTFKITDYISDLVIGLTDYNPTLKIKAFNTSDIPTTDTIFRNFSWNPRAVTLLNQDPINGDKKAVLKISYSEKK